MNRRRLLVITACAAIAVAFGVIRMQRKSSVLVDTRQVGNGSSVLPPLTAYRGDGRAWDETIYSISDPTEQLARVVSGWSPVNGKLRLPRRPTKEVRSASLRIPRLSSVLYEDAEIDRADIELLLRQSDLRELHFWKCRFGPECFRADDRFQALEGLWFTSTPFDNRLLAYFVTASPDLTVLSLVGSEVAVDNHGMSQLTRFRKIEDLELNFATITPSCCDVLMSLATLKQVYVPSVYSWQSCLDRLERSGRPIVVDGADVP